MFIFLMQNKQTKIVKLPFHILDWVVIKISFRKWCFTRNILLSIPFHPLKKIISPLVIKLINLMSATINTHI